MIKVQVVDYGGEKSGICTHSRDHVDGAIVYTREYAARVSQTRPFLNDTYGNALNQNAAFSGTPVVIHDGTDSVAWTGAAVAGTWDFADTVNPYAGTKCTSLTAANNNDQATFTGGATVDGSNYAAITMQLWLDVFNDANHTIELQFALSGVLIGVPVSLNDYINTGTLSEYQGIVIALEDLGIENLTFDRAVITLIRAGGTKPTFRLDAFQVEETGGGITFQVKPDPRTMLYVDEIKFTFVDNVTGNAAKAYNQILGVTLANGLVITRITKDGPVVGRNISSVYDFESFGFKVSEPLDNGTDSMITATVNFSRPLTLNALYEETLNVVIEDDASGWLRATAIARGEAESINGDADLI